MGHKVHPYGFRIGIIKPWLAKWYADRDYATLLQEDMRIRELVARQLSNASVSQVEIERGINRIYGVAARVDPFAGVQGNFGYIID